MLMSPFGSQRTSCWNANATFAGTAKSLCLPPTRQSIAPVDELIF